MKDFEDALRVEKERGAPVRQAVGKNWARIEKARMEGVPLDAIFRALKSTGERVGKGPSSFRQAVKYWDAQIRSDAVSDHITDHNRDGFTDTRFKSDF